MISNKYKQYQSSELISQRIEQIENLRDLLHCKGIDVARNMWNFCTSYLPLQKDGKGSVSLVTQLTRVFQSKCCRNMQALGISMCIVVNLRLRKALIGCLGCIIEVLPVWRDNGTDVDLWTAASPLGCSHCGIYIPLTHAHGVKIALIVDVIKDIYPRRS